MAATLVDLYYTHRPSRVTRIQDFKDKCLLVESTSTVLMTNTVTS